jgi:hypothetical protein
MNFVLLFVLVFSACNADQTVTLQPEAMNPTRLHLQFLTREGCKNTAVMLANLKDTISEGKISADYTVIHQGTLKADDPRTGYPTPTILLNGKDIFGLDVPEPPFPAPS